MTRWNKTQEILQKVRGELRRVRFVRRKAAVDHVCSECKTAIDIGSLFWKRWHRCLHIECFEALQRPVAVMHLKSHGGRKPVLDEAKQKRIAAELEIARRENRDPNFRAMARDENVSEGTIRRFAKGDYLKKAA